MGPETSSDSVGEPEAAADFRAAAHDCLAGFAGWTEARWRADGQRVYDLVQRLADLTADSAGRPRRRVPRLDNPFGLADQFAVVAHDLEVSAVGRGPATYAGAAAQVRQLLSR